jgi:hypothetical protein
LNAGFSQYLDISNRLLVVFGIIFWIWQAKYSGLCTVNIECFRCYTEKAYRTQPESLPIELSTPSAMNNYMAISVKPNPMRWDSNHKHFATVELRDVERTTFDVVIALRSRSARCDDQLASMALSPQHDLLELAATVDTQCISTLQVFDQDVAKGGLTTNPAGTGMRSAPQERNALEKEGRSRWSVQVQLGECSTVEVPVAETAIAGRINIEIKCNHSCASMSERYVSADRLEMLAFQRRVGGQSTSMFDFEHRCHRATPPVDKRDVLRIARPHLSIAFGCCVDRLSLPTTML